VALRFFADHWQETPHPVPHCGLSVNLGRLLM
jgi:hypothetical protein